MITERTLRKWRKEALIFKENIKDMTPANEPILHLCNCILIMTTELLDQHLLRREK